jgi:hypothetical protein
MPIEIAVANKLLMPIEHVRPPAPGQLGNDTQPSIAGRPYPETAVATTAVNPIAILRPPAPGHSRADAQLARAGRSSSQAQESSR